MITAVELISGDYYSLSPEYHKLRDCLGAKNFTLSTVKVSNLQLGTKKSLQHAVIVPNLAQRGEKWGCFPQNQSVRGRHQANLDLR